MIRTAWLTGVAKIDWPATADADVLDRRTAAVLALGEADLASCHAIDATDLDDYSVKMMAITERLHQARDAALTADHAARGV